MRQHLTRSLVLFATFLLPAAAAALTPTPPPNDVELTPGPSGVTASTHDGNVPGNVVDNTLGTRWSAGGDGQWITLAVAGNSYVRSVRIGVYRGNERKNRFDILTSTDGATWTPALTGLQSSGTTTAQETYTLPSRPASHVRYVGHGHVTNAGVSSTMNSVTEIDVTGTTNQPTSPPPPPTGIQAFPSAGMVTLRWTHFSGDGYRVYRSADGCNNFVLIGNASPSSDRSVTFVDPNVVDGRRYYYAVSAYNSVGESARSAVVAATPQLQRPSAPQLTATAGPVDSGRVDLSWTIVPDTATQFTVRRALRPPCWPVGFPTWTNLATADNPARTYSDLTAQPGTRYLYSVVAANSAGAGPSSNIVEVTPGSSSATPTPTVTPCPTASPTPPPPNPSAPPPPPNPVSTDIASGRVQITWTPAGTYPNTATSFSVYRSTSGCGPFAQVARFLSGTRYVDGGLTNGTTYYYVVVGVNARGESLDSEIVSATPAAVPPKAPTGLTAEVLPGPRVRLQWYETFADGYNVKRSTTRGGPYTVIASGVPADTGTTRVWEDTSVTAGGTYYYVVTASSSPGGESGHSNEAEALVPGGSLAAPELRASSGSSTNEIVLLWTAVAGATSYRVRSAPRSCDPFTDLVTVTGTTHTVSTSGNPRQYFVVIAVGAGAESAPSNVAASASAPGLIAPVNFSGTAQEDRVTLSWSLLDTASGYRILRARQVATNGCVAAPSPQFELLATTPYTMTSYVDRMVSPGATYHYRVHALAQGLEGQGRATTVTVPGYRLGPTPIPSACPTPTPTSTPSPTPTPAGTPIPPSSLTASGGHQKVVLNWVGAEPSLIGYRVYRSTASCGPFRVIANSVPQASYVDSGVTTGTSYFYLVTARNGLGEGPQSPERSGAGVNSPPTEVTGLHRVTGPARVVLRWTPSYTSTDYVVRRQGGVVGTVTSDTFTDTTGSPGVTYSYSVAPRNAEGVGPAVFLSASATNAPPPPTGLSATVVGDAIRVQWTASPGATQYKVYRATTADGWFDPRITLATTSWLDPGPFFPDQRYYYRVAAISSAQGDPSDAVSVLFTPGFVEVTPAAAAVTASTHDGNLPGNTVDNNLATRWSGNGTGAWIEYDLGSLRRVGRIGVAVYGGNARKNAFDLQLSTDRASWSVVFRGSSSGTTTQEEAYDQFPAQDARYVRYVGSGAAYNAGGLTSWNSVTEVSVFALPGSTPTPTPTPICSTPPPQPTPPLPPTNVTATAGDGRVTVDWTSSWHRNRVLRSTTSGGPYTVVADLSNSAQGEYVDTDVVNGQRYYYRVQVYDFRQNEPGCPAWTWTNSSPPSEEVSAMPVGADVCVKWQPPRWIISASTNDGNVPANTVDGDLSTRWSGNGDGAWLQFDLETVETVCYVKIAFYRGHERVYRFDLQGSTGGGVWTSLLANAQSSGTTTALQTFDIVPDTSARYLRYVGHGNTVNSYNNVTEFEIWVIP